MTPESAVNRFWRGKVTMTDVCGRVRPKKGVHQNATSRRLRSALWFAVPCLMISAALAGCGGSAQGSTEAYVVGPNGVRTAEGTSAIAVKYTANGRQTLVRERVPGGYFSIIAKRSEYRGKTSSTLEDRFEVSRRRSFETLNEHGLVTSGGSAGLPMEAASLNIQVDHACAGSYSYALAYGILGDPKNSVIARGSGTPVTFKKVRIPLSFQAEGVLVYGLLGPGQATVVMKAPDGHVLGSQRYPGQNAISCHR
jgi:hypothetical protein